MMHGSSDANSPPDENGKESAIGQIDYAILRCAAYGVGTIHDIAELLHIRTIITETHAYRLIKEGFINFDHQKLGITLKGNTAISSFEKDNPEHISIKEFIISTIKLQKERKLIIYKTMNLASIISMIILIMLIMYFGLSIFNLV